MTVVHITARRSLLRAGIVLLAVLAGTTALLLAIYALAGLQAVLLAALAVPATLAVLAARPQRRRAAPEVYPARAQRTVELEDGSLRQAIIVPVEQAGGQADGRQMVLTAEGYMIVDAAGRVIYKL